MRLIDTKTLTLVTFSDERQLPPYAILSHRWVETEEVLFKDLLKRRNEHLKGWQKIKWCCNQAIRDELRYAWIDTCCIDKTSSSELSEAINSMFRWYAGAKVCYAYLNDLVYTKNDVWERDFTGSLWFTRSWTLQELLAPIRVEFYDVHWDAVGERSTLAEEIADASGIQLTVFATASFRLEDYSIAQRMSWASKRTATRIEDIAYSLLGIFDVNMPMLYGEGQKAFQRLQEEIIRRTNDHTVFAWSCPSSNRLGANPSFVNLLASSPAAFQNDIDLVQQSFTEPSPYSVTNLGLAIRLPLEHWAPNVYFAGLNCSKNLVDQVGIFIFKDPKFTNIAYRIQLDLMLTTARKQHVATSYSADLNIATSATLSHLLALTNRLGEHHESIVQVIYKLSTLQQFPRYATYGESKIDRPSGSMMVYPTVRSRHEFELPCINTPLQSSTSCCGTIALLLLGPSYAVMAIRIGLDQNLNLTCILADQSHEESLNRPELGPKEDHVSTNSNSLRGKHFWECSGLELGGEWLLPDAGYVRQPKSLKRGLWALRGQRDAVNVFHLLLRTNYGLLPVEVLLSSNKSNSHPQEQWLFHMSNIFKFTEEDCVAENATVTSIAD